MKVQEISLTMARAILESDKDGWIYHPRGLFLYEDSGYWMTIDNSYGECYVECFRSTEVARAWLETCAPGNDYSEPFPGARDMPGAEEFQETFYAIRLQSRPDVCPICRGRSAVEIDILSTPQMDETGVMAVPLAWLCTKCGLNAIIAAQPVSVKVTNIDNHLDL